MRKNYIKCIVLAGGPLFLFFSPLLVFGQEEDSLKSIALQQVIISASRKEQKVFDVGRNVSVISREKIEQSIYTNVAELLSEEAGIYIIGTNQTPGTNQSLFLRGANSNHTNVLIDGIRLTDPSTPNAALDLSELSLLNVERIEIIRGSHGAMYGTSGIGGVINIITKKGQQPGLNGYADVQAGTFGKETLLLKQNVMANYTFQSGLYTNIAIQNMDVKGMDASVDTVRNENSFKTNDNDDFDKVDALAKIGYEGEKWDIFSSYKYTSQQTAIDAGAYNDDDNYQLDFHRNSLNYGGSYKINDLWKFQYNGGWSGLHRASVNDSSIVDHAGTYDHNYFESDYNGTTFMNEFQTAFAGTNLTFLVGVGHYNEKTDFSTYFFSSGPFPFESAINYDSLDLSSATKYLFAQTNLNGGLLNKSLQKINLSLGARYSEHSRFGRNFSFEFNPSYKLSERALLYASYSTGFNAPSLVQLFDPTQAFGSLTNRGNIGLEPETSASFELGLKQTIGNRISFSVAYFNTEVKNAIEYIYLWNKTPPLDSLSFGDYLGDTYINIAEQKNRGVEFSFEAIVNNLLTINVGFSAVNGVYNFSPSDIDKVYTAGNYVQLFSNGEFIIEEVETEGLVRRPVNTINLNVNYNPLPKLVLTGNTRFVSTRDDSFYDPLLGPFGALNSIQVGSYYLLDLSANYDLNNHFSAGVKVENVLNEEYAEIRGFNTRGRGVYLRVKASL